MKAQFARRVMVGDDGTRLEKGKELSSKLRKIILLLMK
jgi:hypothetical protein